MTNSPGLAQLRMPHGAAAVVACERSRRFCQSRPALSALVSEDFPQPCPRRSGGGVAGGPSSCSDGRARRAAAPARMAGIRRWARPINALRSGKSERCFSARLANGLRVLRRWSDTSHAACVLQGGGIYQTHCTAITACPVRQPSAPLVRACRRWRWGGTSPLAPATEDHACVTSTEARHDAGQRAHHVHSGVLWAGRASLRPPLLLQILRLGDNVAAAIRHAHLGAILKEAEASARGQAGRQSCGQGKAGWPGRLAAEARTQWWGPPAAPWSSARVPPWKRWCRGTLQCP